MLQRLPHGCLLLLAQVRVIHYCNNMPIIRAAPYSIVNNPIIINQLHRFRACILVDTSCPRQEFLSGMPKGSSFIGGCGTPTSSMPHPGGCRHSHSFCSTQAKDKAASDTKAAGQVYRITMEGVHRCCSALYVLHGHPPTRTPGDGVCVSS